MRWTRVILAVLLVVGWTTMTAAKEDALSRLMATRSLKCQWDRGALGDWEGGQLQAKQIPGDLPPLTFDAIDLKNKTARLISNVGSGDVLALLSATGVSFLEQTGIGNFNFTTVFADYSASGDFIAVTSRHLMLLNDPLVSQHHGTCKVPPWGPH